MRTTTLGRRSQNRRTAARRDGYLSSVSTAADILRLFSDVFARELPLSEIARRVGTGKSRTHRLLETLKHKHLIEQDPDTSRYRLGPCTLAMGRIYEYQNRLIQVGRPVVRQLVEQTRSIVHLGVLVEGMVLYLISEFPPGTLDALMPLPGIPYTRAHAHCTALGKAMLSRLDNEQIAQVTEKLGMPALTPATITRPNELIKDIELTRKRGYALDREESTEDLYCLAVPVSDHTGGLLAGLSLCNFKRHFTDDVIEEHVLRLRSYARQITHAASPYRLPVRHVPD